ncbi:MAG TPA: SDR family NAD(P)-dependent oxidoreductase, partial [Deltaproteobacteria bacterium]|nr:SDR family NAD(P)-dependent oxidoreductase [Deltaproteobacteria bacterium]
TQLSVSRGERGGTKGGAGAPREALGRLVAAGGPVGVAVAPGLLDAALHVLAGLQPDAPPSLPFALDRLELLQPGVVPAWVFASRGEHASDLRLLDEDGRVCVAITGLRVRPLGRTVGLEHRLAWVPLELPPGEAEIDGAHDWVEIFEGAGIEDAIAGTHRGLALVQRALATQPPPRLWWLTRGAIVHPGDEGRVDVGAAALWGLGRTVQLEHPELRLTLVDLGPDDDAAEVLRREITAVDGEDQLAWRRGHRWGLRLQRSGEGALPEAITLPQAVLITGGLGALGQAVARWCVARGTRRVGLLGRRGLDTEGAAELVAELEQAGAQATVVAGDVEDAGVISALIDALSPGLVIHAAGIRDDGILTQQTDARASRVLAPKIGGAAVLDAVLADRPGVTLVLFSSLSGALGAAGQGPYAAANASLDALAEDRGRRGLSTISLAFGPWATGMAGQLGDAQQERLRRLGVGTLAEAEALSCLEAALAAGTSGARVVARLDPVAIGAQLTDPVPSVWRTLVRRPRPMGSASSPASP